MKKIFAMTLLLGLMLGASSAFASHLNGTEVPGALTVVRGGLEWAWASPCAAVDGCGGTLVTHHGWTIATAADFLAGFTGFADLDAAFAGGAKCASPYFNSGFDHCDGSAGLGDGSDVLDHFVWNSPAAWGGTSDCPWCETFVVRQVVPEPASLILLGTGIVAVIARKKVFNAGK